MISTNKFLTACHAGWQNSIKQYIADGGCVNVKDSIGISALMHAIGFNREECVQELINAGADIDAKDDAGRTAVMWAVYRGCIGCLRSLVKAGADINARDNSEGRTALMYAAEGERTNCVRELLAAGANVNAKNIYGWTALSMALSLQCYDAAQLLAEYGADIYSKDSNGHAAIDYCKNKRVKAKLIKLSQRHIRIAIKSADKPVMIKGFDAER